MRIVFGAALVFAALAPAQAATLDTSPEKLQALIPNGFRGTRQTDDTRQLVEYVRPPETLDAWTEMYSVAIARHAHASPIAAVLAGMLNGAVGGCLVDPAGDRHTLPGPGFGAGIVTIACGKTRMAGVGEVFVAKIIEGERAQYQVQHAWRLPAAYANSAQMPLPREAMAQTMRELAAVRVCDPTRPETACPP